MRHVPEENPWSPLSVEEVVDLLDGVPGRWWLSGGWALEEHAGRAGRPSRSHGDVDLSVAREDWPGVAGALRSRLQVWIARDGMLHDAVTTPVDGEVENLWLREGAGGPWRLQVNLEDVTGGTWTYRRDRRITRPITEVTWWSGRCWCVAPAVQLL